jgi:hypothetical protein
VLKRIGGMKMSFLEGMEKVLNEEFNNSVTENRSSRI